MNGFLSAHVSCLVPLVVAPHMCEVVFEQHCTSTALLLKTLTLKPTQAGFETK